jgi:hypothetical protein
MPRYAESTRDDLVLGADAFAGRPGHGGDEPPHAPRLAVPPIACCQWLIPSTSFNPAASAPMLAPPAPQKRSVRDR